MRSLLVALLAAILVAGCARPASPRSPSPTPAAATVAPTSEATPLPAAVDLLGCTGPPSEMGGLANDFGPDAGGDTPDAAFDSFLTSMPFTIPRSGYAKRFEDEERAMYAYSANGHVKVVIVISARFADMVGARYSIEELRACDPTEYGPSVDMGEATTVWAHPGGLIMTDIVGPMHCDWQSMRILHLTHEGELVAQYVRDPEGIFPPEVLLETYAERVEVPRDASPSGYRHGDQELWFSESDTALYVVDSSGTAERWPKTARGIGCA